MNIRRAREIAAEYGLRSDDCYTVRFSESTGPLNAKDLPGLADEIWIATKVQGLFDNPTAISQLRRLQDWIELEAKIRRVRL